MRDPMEALLGAIERDRGGVAVVLYPDFGLLEWMVEQVRSLVPEGQQALRTPRVEDVIEHPDRMVLLVPDDEEAVVLDLDGSRDRLRGIEETRGARSAPVVLFLLRDGDGVRALASQAPSLWSWIGGSDVDPERLAEIDVDAERKAFEQLTGETPEIWLGAWRNGEKDHSLENFELAYRAMMLVTP